jgi:peptide/nickel transport system ATP-binding protein
MRFEAKGVEYRYSARTPWILRGVDFRMDAGERVALIGPSGCGKSTLATVLAGYLRPSSGAVLWDGQPLPARGYLPVQLIGQHPELQVNPRWKLSRTLREGWQPEAGLLERMGIEAAWLDRWPAELSGGELQRFCIARALGPATRLLVCDEISTMLDMVTQAQIWNTLLRISEERGMGLLVITHNRPLAERVCGRIVSFAEIAPFFNEPDFPDML